MQCPKCSFENRLDAAFCANCGHEFGALSPPVPSPPAQPNATAEMPTVPPNGGRPTRPAGWWAVPSGIAAVALIVGAVGVYFALGRDDGGAIESVDAAIETTAAVPTSAAAPPTPTESPTPTAATTPVTVPAPTSASTTPSTTSTTSSTTTTTSTSTTTTTTSTSTTTTTSVPSTTTTGPDEPTGDLGIASTPMSQPECNDRYITILHSAVDESTYADDVSDALEAYPDSEYLRTDQTCPSLNPSYEGSAIYVVYFGPYPNEQAACANRKSGPPDAYVKQLSNELPPDHQVPC